MISVGVLVNALVWLVVIGVIAWLSWWALARINPPEPFRTVAEVVLVLLTVLAIIGLLLSLVGGVPLLRP